MNYQNSMKLFDIAERILSIANEIQRSSRKGFAHHVIITNEANNIIKNILNDGFKKFTEIV